MVYFVLIKESAYGVDIKFIFLTFDQLIFHFYHLFYFLTILLSQIIFIAKLGLYIATNIPTSQIMVNNIVLWLTDAENAGQRN